MQKIKLNHNYDPLLFKTQQSDIIFNYLKEFHNEFYLYLDKENIVFPFLDKYVTLYNDYKYNLITFGTSLDEAINEALAFANKKMTNDINNFINANSDFILNKFDLDINTFIDSDNL